MNNQIARRIEELFLVLLISFSVMDFFGVLPSDIGFAKEFVSWAVVGYMFLKASPTSIFFANKHFGIDLMVIISYFLLITKNLVAVSIADLEDAVLTSNIMGFLAANGAQIESYSFYIGGVMLILISVWATIRLDIKKPSLMHVIHEEGPPAKSLPKIAARAFIILLVLLFFFTMVFNLAMEWIAVSLDAPLVMIAIFFYLFVVIRHYERFDVEHIIFKIGKFGEDFYEKFISLFHFKKTLFMGVIGILVLHLLTDLGIFVLPYFFGFKNELYFSQLGEGHTPIVDIMLNDISSAGGAIKIALSASYLLNIFALVFLFLMPSIAWYKIFRHKELHIERFPLALIASSLFLFLLMPSFRIGQIKVEGLAGADILTNSISSSKYFIERFFSSHGSAVIFAAILSIAIGILAYALSAKTKLRKDIFIIEVVFGLGFFAFYLYSYFASIFAYEISIVVNLLKSSEFFIGAYMVIFVMINVLFYSLGFLLFLFEVWRNSHYYKKTKLLKNLEF